MGTHFEGTYCRGEACKGKPGETKYLLLVWEGWWNAGGPDHGRNCLFDSPEDIHKYVAHVYRDREGNYNPADGISYQIIPVGMPPEPLP